MSDDFFEGGPTGEKALHWLELLAFLEVNASLVETEVPTVRSDDKQEHPMVRTRVSEYLVGMLLSKSLLCRSTNSITEHQPQAPSVSVSCKSKRSASPQRRVTRASKHYSLHHQADD